ncbi:(2Fe-2S)-binding protein [Pararhizobium mangrovi]|uniref:(2Fe-2S)-binding protein n=1 Tax=Pararhizobium mangrovi TaxID=2590452 RepID=A0A506U7R7_9HYPH|nr:(2Fe-2S)-binding protein [Pararhizobium mangrovi]TPW30462.1 (2Fe-2S)-binding protein [Pararhizobium mangrovi]
MITLTVNGKTHQAESDPTTPLLYVLRDEMKLNGAKYGCGLGQCGSCTVLLEDKPVFSCQIPISVLEGRKVTTLEGLGTIDEPGRVQKAFIDEQAAQCGYCIAGMIMRSEGLLRRNAFPSDAEIRDWMQPNLCRCGTHSRILKAVRRAANAESGA